MNLKMLVSIVIPSYNTSKAIVEALKSIKAQTYSEIEVLVVLDGCTDDTKMWCKKCKKADNRIRIIEQENQGTFNARYKGIENAKGDYVMFLDSDDYLKPGALEMLVNIVQKTKTDLIRYRYERIQNGVVKYAQDCYLSNEKEISIEKKDFKEKVYNMFLEGYMLNSVNVDFIKRTCIPEKMTHRRITFGEDLLFNLNLFSIIENVTFFNEPLYGYCPNEKSITRTKDVSKLLNNLNDAQYVYLELLDKALEWSFTGEALEKLKVRILYEFTTLIYKINKTGVDVKEEINNIFNNEKYKKFLKTIDKTKIKRNTKNYELIMQLLKN